MMRFRGKTALITGSSRGIGRAVACRLASEGASVILHCNRNRAVAEQRDCSEDARWITGHSINVSGGFAL